MQSACEGAIVYNLEQEIQIFHKFCHIIFFNKFKEKNHLTT